VLLLPRRERPPGEEAQPRRVLVIDDDLTTLRLLRGILENEGYLAETAGSPDLAIEKLQFRDFDVILADIVMPDFDGRTLYRFLAVLLPHYADRVIFVTADQSPDTLRFFQECRRPHLFKPIDREQLMARLREVCSPSTTPPAPA